MRGFFHHPGRVIFCLLWFFILAGNFLAVCSRPFADLWRDTGFFPVSFLMGSVTTLLPFSLGEWALLAGVLITVLLPFAALFRFRKYLIFYGFVFTIVCALLTSNCFILYHCSPFGPAAERRFSIAELQELRDHLVLKANELALQLPRNEEGDILLPVNGPTYEDTGILTGEALAYLGSRAKEAMTDFGSRAEEGYDRTRYGGAQVNPKPIFFSFFLCQQNMAGYYFPFTMEANVNRYMYTAHVPFTLCHELSHIRGNLYEDDANFIAYLACVESGDPLTEYSGIMSVVNYLERDWRDSIGSDPELLNAHPTLCPEAMHDNIFLKEEVREMAERESPFSSREVRRVSDSFTEGVLKLNGVESGMASYGEVVERLLVYYAEHEFP